MNPDGGTFKMRKPLALLIATMLVVIVASGVNAQEDKKVISTSTDSRGFETRHTELDLMIQTAKALMDAKQYEKAAAEFEKVMAKDFSRLDALHDLGTCYKNLKQYDKAAKAYYRAVKSHPDDERLLVNLAYYQIRSKDVEGAASSYQALLAMEPGSYEAHKGLGYIYDKTGEKEKALGHYQKAVEARPTDFKTMGSVASIYVDMGQMDKAMQMYEQLIESSPEDVALNYKAEVGKMYIKQQNYQKSAWLFKDLCTAIPDNYTHRYNYAISLIQLKRHNEAVPELVAAIKIKPDFCPSYQALATSYQAGNRFSDAIKTVQTGLGVCAEAKKGGLYYEWGRSLEGLTRYDEAITKFELALNDGTWGESAKRQIKRQQDLIKRAKAMQNQ
jgi:tetratricopeptide (TPR) repeat protein